MSTHCLSLNYLRLKHCADLLIRLCEHLQRVHDIENDAHATPLLRGVGACLTDLNAMLLQTVICLLNDILRSEQFSQRTKCLECHVRARQRSVAAENAQEPSSESSESSESSDNDRECGSGSSE